MTERHIKDPKLFVGKTIAAVEWDGCAALSVAFTDGTYAELTAQDGAMPTAAPILRRPNHRTVNHSSAWD